MLCSAGDLEMRGNRGENKELRGAQGGWELQGFLDREKDVLLQEFHVVVLPCF